MNFNNFLADGGKASDWLDDVNATSFVDYAVGGRQGVSLVLTRSGSTLAAQDAVLAPISSRSQDMRGGAGDSGQSEMVIIGAADMNIRRGDRFSIGTARYEVTFVDNSLAGRTEARAKASQ